MSKYHIEIETDREFVVVAHLRGYCHNSEICRLCEAEDRALKAELYTTSIITGEMSWAR